MTKNLLGTLLATSMALSALAGCAVPSPVSAPKAGMTRTAPSGGQTATTPGAALTPVQQQAAAQTTSLTTQALTYERELTDFSYLLSEVESGAAAYSILQAPDRPAEAGGAGAEADAEAEASATSAPAEEEASGGERPAEGDRPAGPPADRGAKAKAAFKDRLPAHVQEKLEARQAKI
ncbi:MAG: hypothetical protein ACLGIN_17725, partial [Candidatus Sericytochromatia bacterium]